VLPSEFQAQFPDGEFSALTGDYVQKFLNAATPFFDVGSWGSWYSEGLSCYVAHSIVVSKARAARGIVQMNGGNTTEKHVGPVGTSFDSQILNKQLSDTFLLTDYGRRYCELRDMVGLGGTIAAGSFAAADGLDEVLW
jgi:hypothetical protein